MLILRGGADMKKRTRGKIAGILILILLGLTILPNDVFASETVSDVVTGEDDNGAIRAGENEIKTTEDKMIDGVTANEEMQEKQSSEVQSGEQGNIDNAAEKNQGLINYVGVEFPYLQTPEEQKVVVSFGDNTENISDVHLSCKKADGNILELELDKKENELYLFRYRFSEEETGVYRLLYFSYMQDGVEQIVELSKIGIDAMFGVNEYYPGYRMSTEDTVDFSKEDVDISVVEIDADKVEDAESDIEEAIEETVEVIEKTENVSKESKGEKARSSYAKTKDNVVVVLDPGHGGSDGGAQGYGLSEKNLTLKIAQYCKDELEKYNGVDVYMTRDNDVYVELSDRVSKAKKWDADVFVSIHINSSTNGSANGVEVFYPNSSYNSEVHSQGKELADDILRQLTELGLRDRGITIRNSDDNSKYPDGSTSDYYSVIRNSKLNGFPGIIVEHAFISNYDDAAKLWQDIFLQQLGVADAAGIANYFNLTKGASIKIENKDDFEGTAQVKVNGLGDNAKVKIWNDNNMREYPVKNGRNVIDFNIKDFGDMRGQYYVEAFNSSGVSLDKVSFYVSRDVKSSISVNALDNKETQYGVAAEFIEMPQEVKNVQFATWSEQGGQDDLVWYQGKQNSSGTWMSTVDVRRHKTSGKYNIHAYAMLENGNMKYLGAATFTISSPTLKIVVGEYQEAAGTFDVVLTDIRSVSGVNKIEVPVWSTSDQSDIRWYEAEKQNNGNYKVTVNIANHNYSSGPYRIHTYTTTGNGVRVCTGIAPEKTVTLPKMEVSGYDSNGKEILYTLKVTNTSMIGVVRNIQFATWSEQGGQDDIIWYQGTKGTNDTWTATADIRKHKTVGKYNVHAYAMLPNGGMKYLGAAVFTVSLPTLNIEVGDYQESEGIFNVVLTNVKSASGVSKVEVPVWSTSNQSDIRWYEAKKQNDGSYKVAVNIANHNYSSGPYRIHTYVTGENKARGCAGIAPEKMIKLPEMKVSATDTNGKEMLYALSVNNMNALKAVKSVQFATWSEQGGQDDIIWYQGIKGTNDVWTATADIRKHKTVGKYNVHAYAILTNGKMKYLGAAVFTVSSPKLNISVSDYQESKGVFDVVLTDVQSASDVTKVEVPVWSTSNQSDIHWYEAKKQNSGSYKVSVNIANHNYSTGPYRIHTYVTAENGTRGCAGIAPEKIIELPEMTVSAVDTNGKETLYSLEISNIGILGAVRNIQFATWGDQGRQEDIIWYQGKKEADGVWTATADIRKHKLAGKYNVHVYATLLNGNMKFLGSTTFAVSEAEVSEVEIQDYDEMTGYFKVVIVNPQSVSGVDYVEVPVWCAGNQSDIKWYRAEKQKDGNYFVNVNPSYHNYNTGLYKIDVYVSSKNGVKSLTKSVSQQILADYTIMGETTITVDQMIRYYESSKKSYPAVELGKGGAFTLKEFCQMYYEEAKAEGVRAEVAFTQAMKETGWLQYKGIVRIEQFNFAGIGALDGNSQGNCASFPDVRTGIRAQIQHLKAYGCSDPLVNAQVDPRFGMVKRGCAPYVKYLGQKENPEGLGWATAVNYGNDIVSMIKDLKSK